MAVTLNKGQKVELKKSSGSTLTKVRMGLGWDARKVRTLFGRLKEQAIDLDASCLLFDGAKNLVDQVWFSQLRSKDGALQHLGDNRTGVGEGDDESIVVDLDKVSANIETLVFVVNSYSGESFSQIENAFCRLVDTTTEQEIARYDLSGSGPHTAQVMAKLTRSGAGWDMTALGVRTEGRTIRHMLPAVLTVL